MFTFLKQYAYQAVGAVIVMMLITIMALKVSSANSELKAQVAEKNEIVTTANAEINKLNLAVHRQAEEAKIKDERIDSLKETSTFQAEQVEVLTKAVSTGRLDLSKRINALQSVRDRVIELALKKPEAITRLVNERNSKIFKRVLNATKA